MVHSLLATVAAIAVFAGSVAASDPRSSGWVDRSLQELREAAEAVEWSDQHVRHDWRLQRHVDGLRWRILDPHEHTVASGSLPECQAVFDRLEQTRAIPALDGAAVLVLHGLGEGRRSMQPLVEHLRNNVDAIVMTVGYASSSATIEEHSRSLGAVIDRLPPATPLDFVGHSLGNIVVRRWMATAPTEVLTRVRRVVMLGPPNQGSDLARMASRLWFLAMLAHGATRELCLDWNRIAPNLAVPPCEFGIVAGGRGDDRGMSPLLAGDDDAIVRVAETRLDGATDFLLLPVHHAAMMEDERVQKATVCFLRQGRFSNSATDGSQVNATDDGRSGVR